MQLTVLCGFSRRQTPPAAPDPNRSLAVALLWLRTRAPSGIHEPNTQSHPISCLVGTLRAHDYWLRSGSARPAHWPDPASAPASSTAFAVLAAAKAGMPSTSEVAPSTLTVAPAAVC